MARQEMLLTDGTRWVDVTNPSRQELEELAREYGLHATSVQDCLQPEHLPKLERFGDVLFVVTRAYDQACSPDADSVQELTRKIAIFRGPKFLITVHRKDQPFLKELRLSFTSVPSADLSQLTAHILKTVARSFQLPIDDATNRVDDLETATFRGNEPKSVIEDAYYLHRRSSVVKRVLRLTVGVIAQLDPHETVAPYFRDAKDEAEQLLFFADELLEKVKSLIELHLSLQSHRTNEVVRVLTIFSAFFMPLTFIASIYGMNFHFMPELDSKVGYPLVLTVMLVTATGIYQWFKRKGWLKQSI